MNDTVERTLALRHHFLGWQCRIRQYAIRESGGRPTPGMRPTVTLADAGESMGRITVLVLKRDSAHPTAQFRHLVKKTHDPVERYTSALKFLAAAYYQNPHEFADEMTALFGPDSNLAARLLDAGACVLEFEQFSQRYRLSCNTRRLAEDDPAWQATYWHNSLFNPHIPGASTIVGFEPQWDASSAEPDAA